MEMNIFGMPYAVDFTWLQIQILKSGIKTKSITFFREGPC